MLIPGNGFPFSFFENRPYPVVEAWAYFNDIYFYNPDNGQMSDDLPLHWKDES